MHEYDAWAVFYDFIHHGLPGEVEFYVGLAAEQGLDTLELGCGTGRIALPMAMSGVNVTGLDLSRNMLYLCAEKAYEVGDLSGRLGLIQGDMRAFAFRRQFPLIIMPYRTFMHLLTPADQVRCLECVRAHLAPGGRFIFNLWAARPSQIARASTGRGGLEQVGEYEVGEDLRLVHYHAADYNEHLQRIRERHRIEERGAEDALLDTAELSLVRAWFTPREMEHLIHRCGFKIIDVLGDFEGGLFTSTSSEMIWVLSAD